jgi:hypothetical protein
MRTSIVVDGKEPATLFARVSLRLPFEERRHTPLLDIVQVLDETVVVAPGVPGLEGEQVLAREALALVTEADLLFGQFHAQAFFVDAAPATGATSGAPGL